MTDPLVFREVMLDCYALISAELRGDTQAVEVILANNADPTALARHLAWTAAIALTQDFPPVTPEYFLRRLREELLFDGRRPANPNDCGDPDA